MSDTDWISSMPYQLDYLRDIVAKMEEYGPDWIELNPDIRGNPSKVAESIELLKIQITEGERILHNALLALGND